MLGKFHYLKYLCSLYKVKGEMDDILTLCLFVCMILVRMSFFLGKKKRTSAWLYHESMNKLIYISIGISVLIFSLGGCLVNFTL